MCEQPEVTKVPIYLNNTRVLELGEERTIRGIKH